MARSSQHGAPLLVPSLERGASAQRLERLPFQRARTNGPGHDEGWIQRLIHEHPAVLPIAELEPALTPAVPICLELPTPAGFVDNLFLTPNGGIVLAECKLWRNPEARREVVAQVLDYTRALSAWRHDDLERAVAQAVLPDGSHPDASPWSSLAAHDRLDEAEFVDAVSRNLRLGRFLWLIVGDGIREGAEALAGALASHAGHHFTLAFVELGIFGLPDGSGWIVQPRVPARTLNIERGIVRFDPGALVVDPPQPARDGGGPGPITLSEEMFFEALAMRDPDAPDAMRRFLGSVEALGVSPELEKTLILRWRPEGGPPFNLGYVDTRGAVWTNAAIWKAGEIGAEDLVFAYLTDVAGLVGGRVARLGADPYAVDASGRAPRVGALLAHADAWRDAIARFVAGVRERIDEAAAGPADGARPPA